VTNEPTYSSPEAKRFFTWFDGVCERAEKSPVGKMLRPNGWQIAHTGGGCLAWQFDRADEKFYVWITYGGDGLGERVRKPDNSARFAVGLYGADGGWINPPEIVGLSKAMAWCDVALADPARCMAEAIAKDWPREPFAEAE